MSFFKKLAGVAIGALALVGASNAADAATITPFPAVNGISIEGDIVPGDAQRLLDAFKQMDPDKETFLMLNSMGGDVEEATKIVGLMAYVQKKGHPLATMVTKRDTCASACTYIWAMGTKKLVTFGGQLYVHASVSYDAKIGLDASTGESTGSEAVTLRVARFYKITGAPDSVIIKALDYNPDGNVLGYEEIIAWGGKLISETEERRFAFTRCLPGDAPRPLNIPCDN